MLHDLSKVLVLAPHTDDGELGCGASLSKLQRLGHEIHYVAFCTCDSNLPDGYPDGTLAESSGTPPARFRFLQRISIFRTPRSGDRRTSPRRARHNGEARQTLESRHRLLPNIGRFTPRPFDRSSGSPACIQEEDSTELRNAVNNISFHANCLVEVGPEDVQQDRCSITL